MYTHRGAYLNSFGEVLPQRIHGDTRYLWTLPMFHCNGWCTPWAVTAAGGTHVCLRAVAGRRIWRPSTAGVTNLCGAPTVCSTIAGRGPGASARPPLRITTAGAPPAPTVIGRSTRSAPRSCTSTA